LKFLGGHFTISQDLRKKTSPDILASMDRNNCASAIGVLEKMMAAFAADNFKPGLAQGSNKATAGDGWKGAHVLTVNGYTLDAYKLV
jgi:hypothetical protein